MGEANTQDKSEDDPKVSWGPFWERNIETMTQSLGSVNHDAAALERAAREFDRRAMEPHRSPAERCAILVCATWLRDMADAG